MSAADETLARLRRLAILRISGEQVGSDQLIAAGLNALLAGVDAPSLPMLAGLTRREEPEAPELFDRVVDELGLAPTLPAGHRQALWAMARWWAELITSGLLDPLTGGELIWTHVAIELDSPAPLQDIVTQTMLAGDRDHNWSISLDEIEAEITRAAQEFLALPTLYK